MSTQVLIELFHTLTRQQKMPPATARALVRAYAAWPLIDSDLGRVGAAVETSVAHQLSIWDAMVIEARAAPMPTRCTPKTSATVSALAC